VLRKKLNLHCKQKRKFKVTTDSKHHLPFAPNILKRAFFVSAPDKAWVSDITYIPTGEGWLYLTGIKDLFNGESAGYAIDERMTTDLVIQALFCATNRKFPKKGLVLHSDRGSQYRIYDYQEILKQFGMISSMSAKGDCWDSALWKASGESSKMNWYIIENSKHGYKQNRRLPNISRSFITGSENRKNQAICRL